MNLLIILASLYNIPAVLVESEYNKKKWEEEVELKNSSDMMIFDGTWSLWYILGHGVFQKPLGSTLVVNIWLHMGMHAK